MVDLYVGSKRRHFRVHKKLLCYHSAFFDKAFEGKFKEGHEGMMYLPKDDPAAFEIFVNWLYRGSIDKLPTSDDLLLVDKALKRIVGLYILADKLCINPLKNAAMNSLQQGSLANNSVLYLSYTLIYESTVAGSPLRRFAAKLAVWDLQGAWDRDLFVYVKEGANPDIARDIIELFREHIRLPDPRRPSKCEYHEHAKGETCHLQLEKK